MLTLLKTRYRSEGTTDLKLFPAVQTLVLEHAYQSLACETAINTDFSELLSLRRTYIKHKNAILLLIGCFFHT